MLLVHFCHRAGEVGLKSTFLISSLGPRNYESKQSVEFLANQLLDFSGFVLWFVLIPSLDLHGHLFWSWRPSLVVTYIILDPVDCSMHFPLPSN